MAMRMEMDKTHTPPSEVAIVLGRVPELSVREIELTLARTGYTDAELTVASGVALVKVDPKPDDSWFSLLGGATKFGRVIGRTQPTLAAVAAVCERADTVGISVLGLPFSPTDLGRELKASNIVRRYVVPTHGGELSAAQAKGIDREYLALKDGEGAVVVAIEAVQDIDAFTLRDRSLPVVDPVRGMLPTKLARTMANMGLGLISSSTRPVVLDPFCGTGRILIEAALLGADVLGADSDPAAVDASRRNLEWARSQFGGQVGALSGEQVVAAPIEKLDGLLSKESVDVIVTEPYLGPPQRQIPSQYEVRQIFDELAPLYGSLIKAARHVLRPAGGLVVVFPAIGSQSLLDALVDRIDQFGYHALDTFRVERPDSVVSRVITTLTRK